jgi:alkylation response protein AidB-like acyl-CoA dehydrogenase
MDFELNDEQRQLSDSLERLLTQQYGVDQRRAILQSQGGFSQAIWSKLADIGIFSLPVSEQAGGFGGGAVDLMRPMTLLGDALVVEPVIPHLAASRLLDRATGGSDPAAQLLQRAIAGEQRLVWVRDAVSGGETCTATPSGGGWTLSGRFTSVFGADGASHLLVTALADSQPALFVVPAATPNVTLRPGRALDNQPIADLAIDGVRLEASARLGSGSAVSEAVDDAADFASALLCAEAVGVIDYACRDTLEYLKTRKQFGVPIGSFQALQHRIVDLHVELEQVRSIAALACSRLDAASSGQVAVPMRTKAVAAARVLVGKAATKVAQESVQLHGGMGMAEEMKISHAFRRLTVLAHQWGDVDYFLDRFIAADKAVSVVSEV